MQERSKDITIYVTAGETTWTLTTYEGEYRSLMALIHDQVFTEDFGECGGVGRCGTCAVVLTGAGEALQTYDRNEATTLGRLDIELENVRLACQLPVNAALHGLQVRVITP